MSDYGETSFGTGSYGNGNDFLVPISNPPGIGYGGIGYGNGSYGGIDFSLPNPPSSGGYGGDPYGQGIYGGLGEITPPSLVSAISITGFQIELFFSEPMQEDPDLFNPVNYTLAPVFGAALSSAISIEPGIQTTYGVTSVLLNHTGTTLGGIYNLTVVEIKDLGGSKIQWNGQNQVELLTKGEPPDFTAIPLSGTEILLDFEYDMLTEAEFSPGIEETSSYEFTSEYPILPLLDSIQHPYLADLSQVLLTVSGMTSTEYGVRMSPATAIEYDASELPSQAFDFISHVIGTGNSSINNGLVLSTLNPHAYGWSFEDASEKILPNSSYRLDLNLDLSNLNLTSLLTKAIIFSAIISDGVVQTRIDFRLTNIGIGEELVITSGGFSQSIKQKLLGETFQISWVRNQKADTYTLAINNSPIFSELTGVFNGNSSIPPGLRFLINTEGQYDISNFILSSLLFTSSQTIFSAAWNFLHNQLAFFLGLAGATKDFILTSKGPLVKAWGNATPATKQDVEVRINGIPIEIEDVNPYMGKIFPVIPIPLLSPGIFDVEIDYKWMFNPVFPFAGLNTEGLVLNKFDPKPLIGIGVTQEIPTPVLGDPIQGNFHKFPYGLSLNGVSPRQPLQRSSRFIAFQRQYTAALNSPNTLILNANPHIIKKPSEVEMTEGMTVFYEGSEDPTLANPTWILIGQQGELEAGEGDGDLGFDGTDNPEVYSVLDTSSGSFGVGQPSFYVRSETIPFSSSINYVTRFVITEDVELFPNGVFTGVGFGYHNNNFLYLVGALQINGLQHIGMLTEPSFPEKSSSWKLGYEEKIEILSSNTFSLQNLPKLVQERLTSKDLVRFQILEGPQQGTYEILEILFQGEGTTLSCTPEFPSDFTIYGNNFANLIFEIRWDGDGDRNRPLTYRLIIKDDLISFPQGYAELYIGGSLSGKALELSGVPAFAIPPDGVLLYPTGEESEFFWGSLSRPAENSSDWNFVRYGVEPGMETVCFDGITVYADMLELPQEDPNHIWFLTQEFGSFQIDTKNQLVLKATSSSSQEAVEGLDLTIGYSRFEPFFTKQLFAEVIAYLQVDSGILGSQDASIILDDAERVVNLSTILYQENLGEKFLLTLQEVSLSGLLLPEAQGWNFQGEEIASVQGQRIQIHQSLGQEASWTYETFPEEAITNNRILDTRFRAFEYSGPNDTGIFFGVNVGPLGSQRGIGIRLIYPNEVQLYSLSNGAPVSSFEFEWFDSKIHDLRVLVDSDSDVLSLVLDDIPVGTAFVTSFDFHQDEVATFGFESLTSSLSFEIEDFSVTVLPPNNAKRTLGILKRNGNSDQIDGWVLPRLDGTDVPNSSMSSQIQEIDWTSLTKIRLYRDPTWGVILQLPQLGVPPYYTGDFATQSLIPSSGWISVEYSQLPISKNYKGLGRISFGALDPRSVTQQRWDFFKYRIFQYPGKDKIAPQWNVLNRYNVITSGEFLQDREVESVIVLSRNSTTINVFDSGMHAKIVYNFSYINKAGQTVVFNPESFTFDEESQTITIISETTLAYQPSQDLPDLEDPGVINPSLNDESWPFDNPSQIFEPDGLNPFLDSPPLLSEPVKIPVTINFLAGKPYSKEYICSQPLEAGSTILNEGTPDYTIKLVATPESEVQFNSQLNDPNDLLQGEDPIILNDFPYLGFLSQTGVCSPQYENIEFCEVSSGDEGLLSPFCDDNVPVGHPGIDGSQEGDIGNGLINISFSGLTFTETEKIGFTDGPPQEGFVNTFIHAGLGELGDAIIIPDLGDDIPVLENAWSVVGFLYNTITKQTEKIYFVQGE